MDRHRLTLVSLVWCVAAVAAQPLADPMAQVAPSGTLPGFALPSAKAALSADRTARLAKRVVEPGALVKAGMLVAQLDDDVQQVRVQLAEHRAAATHAIELAKVNVATAQRELDRFLALDGQTSASRKEVNDARDELASAQLALKEAKFNQQQAELDAALQRAILDEFAIRAPFDGVVLEFDRDVGETVEESDPIVTIVRLNPLQVQIDCPLQRAFNLSVGARATVIPRDPALKPQVGQITYVSVHADEGSQTVRVHIDVPNADNAWPGGVRVNVRFDETVVRGPHGVDAIDRTGPVQTEEHSNAR